MFSNLIESGSHAADLKRKGRFLLGTIALYCLLFVATFLPWTSFNALYVNGGEGVRSFSGWDLTTDCTTRAVPGQCVLEEHSLSPEFVPLRVVAGDWASATSPFTSRNTRGQAV